MRKLLGIAAAAMLLALTGCGGADDVADDENTSGDSTQSTTESTDSNAGGDYCDELKQAQENFSGMTEGQLNEETYNQLIEQLETIIAAAPADVKDDWQSAHDTLTKVHDLLGEANIDFDDFQDIQAGQVPPDADLEQLQKLAKKFTQLSQDMNASDWSTNIQQSAQQDCGLTFN